MLSKAYYASGQAELDPHLDTIEGAVLLYLTLVPVLFHNVTAAIYAYKFRARLWAAFIASCLIHIGFDVAVEYSSEAPVAVLIAMLAAATVVFVGALTIMLRDERVADADHQA